MRLLKQLSEVQWPAADHKAFEEAFRPGGLFDETGGPGAHLAEGSRNCVRMGYRRWLGFPHANHPDDLLRPPADRISLERVREFIAQPNSEMHRTSVAATIQSLCYAARLIAGDCDWGWLRHRLALPCRMRQSKSP